MTIEQIPHEDVLLNIINNEDVFMCRKYQNGSICFTCLRDVNVGKINEYLKKDDVIFFIIK